MNRRGFLAAALAAPAIVRAEWLMPGRATWIWTPDPKFVRIPFIVPPWAAQFIGDPVAFHLGRWSPQIDSLLIPYPEYKVLTTLPTSERNLQLTAHVNAHIKRTLGCEQPPGSGQNDATRIASFASVTR